MLNLCLVLIFIFVNVLCDVNYFVRTLFTLISSRVYQQKHTLNDTSTIYGIGTFLDCDIYFKHVRIARIIRELDIARYHFYDTTGIYRRSQNHKIHSLQGCTMTVTMDPVPIFEPYKINTKLVYWDDRSLFLEHKVVTLRDGKLRCFLISRQHAIGKHGDPIDTLLKDLPGSERIPDCPEYLNRWLESMQISSTKLRQK